MHYTQEQIDRANAVSLEDFLRSQGEELIKSGSEYRWKKHDSLTVCENKWFRHSQSKGGFPVDFVMEFYDKSFPEAVALLLNDTGYSPDRNEPQFRLPARSDSKEAAYRYLSEKRKIAPSLLDVFFKAGDIFEDAAHRNVVFIGRDKDGIPRCAHARGMEDQSRRDVSGSDKSCGFSYRGSGNQLFVFEAPIDLLSFICTRTNGCSGAMSPSAACPAKPLTAFSLKAGIFGRCSSARITTKPEMRRLCVWLRPLRTASKSFALRRS